MMMRRGEGGQGEGEVGGHQVHQVCHAQQQQQPAHAGHGLDCIGNKRNYLWNVL